MKTHHLFISHSWEYSGQYRQLENLLDQARYFSYRNYSVPRDNPIHINGNTVRLRKAITEKIRNVHVVLVLAGVYSTYRKWINIEIEIAKKSFSNKKPVIAIEPWESERTSQHVKENADRIVGWNTKSIVSAIKELA